MHRNTFIASPGYWNTLQTSNARSFFAANYRREGYKQHATGLLDRPNTAACCRRNAAGLAAHYHAGRIVPLHYPR